MTCAVFGDGTRDCFGNGRLGQFGTGTSMTSSTFTHVGVAATTLALDSSNACFVESAGVRWVGTTRFGLLTTTPPGATPQRIDLACHP